MSPLAHLIRKHSEERIDTPANIPERLPALAGIRCLAFDIYGTLFSSGAGSIETFANDHREVALSELFQHYKLSSPLKKLTPLLDELISRDHAQSRTEGIEFPEVDIRQIWQHFFDRLDLFPPEIEEFAVRYELKTNPLWPTLGAKEILHWSQTQGLTMALVSNAQFYTPLLFPALLEKEAHELGFSEDCIWYSYQHRHAKPGSFLFENLASALQEKGITPGETLYLGNDALNDVHPAAAVGFKTALFAGSTRSLRLRKNHPHLHQPDAIIRSFDRLRDLVT